MNAEANESPRDYMLRIMRSPSADPARRDAMARACAPYVHAQLQAVAQQPATRLGWTPTSTRGRPPLGARPMTAVRAQAQAVSPAARRWRASWAHEARTPILDRSGGRPFDWARRSRSRHCPILEAMKPAWLP